MVQTFTKEQFEAALKGKAEYLGLEFGEHEYAIYSKHNSHMRIKIRSSVGANNQSGGTGENSIRLYVQFKIKTKKDEIIWVNFSDKIDAYTTRLSGWDKRLTAKIYWLMNRYRNLKEGEVVRLSKWDKVPTEPFITAWDNWIRICEFVPAVVDKGKVKRV